MEDSPDHLAEQPVRLPCLAAAWLLVPLGLAAQASGKPVTLDPSHATPLDGWHWLHDTEGWTSKVREARIIRDGPAPTLRIVPSTSVWFFDYIGPFLYRDVVGDFVASMRLRVTGTRGALPTATYSLAGLMARQPRTGAPFRSDSTWRRDREHYLFASIGIADRPAHRILETKSTVRSYPMVKHFSLPDTGYVDLRLARIGRNFLVLYRQLGSPWQLHERWDRHDLGDTLQVGTMAYGDFSTIESSLWYDPWRYNTTPPLNGVADMIVDIASLRVEPLMIPSDAEAYRRTLGVQWTDHRIDNASVLRLIPALGAP
jgi:hypothetical protein